MKNKNKLTMREQFIFFYGCAGMCLAFLMVDLIALFFGRPLVSDIWFTGICLIILSIIAYHLLRNVRKEKELENNAEADQ